MVLLAQAYLASSGEMVDVPDSIPTVATNVKSKKGRVLIPRQAFV
jgi:hypothetical protein